MMAANILVALALLVSVSHCSGSHEQLRRARTLYKRAAVDTNNTKLNDTQSGNIFFELPDIVTEMRDANGIIVLEAFRIKDKFLGPMPQWVSFGYPHIVMRNGDLFEHTEDFVTIYIRHLDSFQQNELFKAAKRQYKDLNVTLQSIVPIPIAQFLCEMHFTLDKVNYVLRGKADSLKKNPFPVKFHYEIGSEKREALAKRAKLGLNHPLFFECTLVTAGQKAKRNTLHISSEQFQSIGAGDLLLGDGDEAYVTRDQMSRFSAEAMSRMKIEEMYELENEDFTQEFIEKVLGNESFRSVNFADAMKSLSTYGIPMDNKDLLANNITSELSDRVKVSNMSGKSVIHVDKDTSRSSNTSSNIDVKTKVNGGIPGLGSAEASFDYAKTRENMWAGQNITLDEQVQEINAHSESPVKWGFNGTKFYPKSLDVAKVTEQTFKNSFNFMRVKTRLSNATFVAKYSLNTNVDTSAGLTNTQLGMIVLPLKDQTDDRLTELHNFLKQFETAYTEAEKQMLQQLNSSMQDIEYPIQQAQFKMSFTIV